MEPLRILWGSPLPPTRSGVSDYATEVLGPLSRLARVRVLKPPGTAIEWEAPEGVESVPHDTAPEPGELSLVHIGNNPYHEWLLERARSSEAVVVLHDVVLHHLLVEATVAHGRNQDFEDLLAEAHGDEGRDLAKTRRLDVVGKLDPFLLPATAAVIGGARAAVVHSHWAADQVSQICPEMRVGAIGMPATDPGELSRKELRDRLDIPSGAVVLMHLGFATEEKGLDVILGAVAAARRCGAPAHLLVCGEGAFMGAFKDAVAALGLGDAVSMTGWVAKEDFVKLPAAADLGVVLRAPSAGETSAAVVRFLACGTPVAVTGRRQFLEWPEDATPRVGPASSAMADLTRILLEAADQDQQGLMLSRRKAARRVYEDHHRPETVVAQLVGFLRSLG